MSSKPWVDRLTSLRGQEPAVAVRVMLKILFPPLDGRCDDKFKPLAASTLAGKAKRDVDNAMPMQMSDLSALMLAG